MEHELGESKAWIEVALLTVAFGGIQLLWSSRKRKAANVFPVCSYLDIVFYALFGFQFGILATYGWGSFHKPILLVSLILALIGTLVTGSLKPAKRSSKNLR
jgi:hypothetical protein